MGDPPDRAPSPQSPDRFWEIGRCSMSSKNIHRFPRLSTPQGVLNHYAAILRATYNRLVKDRKFRWKQYQYDICRINPDAWRHFITLADILYKEKIDPSRYLKVLAKYGFFSNKGIMPPLAWLAKPKALETYRWKVKREREMYPGKTSSII
jgi:hypothetical protein